MATVRFSGELKTDIIHRAEHLFQKRINDAEEAMPDKWGAGIYDKLFEKTRKHMDALPENYFETLDTFTIDSLTWTDRSDFRDYSVRIQLGQTRRLPPTLGKELHGLMQDAGNTRFRGLQLDGNDPRWEYLKTGYTKHCQAIDALVAKKKEFTDGVKAVITTFSTLAPALKEWPALWDLLDEDVQERHKKIVSRTKRVVTMGDGENAAVNLNKMTAAVVATKLTS